MDVEGRFIGEPLGTFPSPDIPKFPNAPLDEPGSAVRGLSPEFDNDMGLNESSPNENGLDSSMANDRPMLNSSSS